MSDTTRGRDADDARSDDGPPTDAVSDEVKTDAADITTADADAAGNATEADADSTPRSDDEVESATAQVDEPTD